MIGVYKIRKLIICTFLSINALVNLALIFQLNRGKYVVKSEETNIGTTKFTISGRFDLKSGLLFREEYKKLQTTMFNYVVDLSNVSEIEIYAVCTLLKLQEYTEQINGNLIVIRPVNQESNYFLEACDVNRVLTLIH